MEFSTSLICLLQMLNVSLAVNSKMPQFKQT